jgi:hypothetical protein
MKKSNSKTNSSTSTSKWVLHPYADYVGCNENIYLGSFSSKAACDKAGKDRHGSNGVWCCVKK